MEKILNQISKKVKLNTFLYIVFAIVCCITYYGNLKIANQEFFLTEFATKYSIIYFVGCVIFAIVIGIVLAIISKKNNLPIHKKFFVIAGIVGIVFLFTAPFFSGGDEQFHFYRIYEISKGSIVTPKISDTISGSTMPKSIEQLFNLKKFDMNYSDVKDAIKLPLNPNDTKLYENYYNSASVYSPIQYIPQLIGVFIGRICNANIYMVGIFGRITGFIFWLFLCTYAIKILPVKKIFAMIMLLTPISISFATTLSADLVTNSMALLFISYICNICYTKRKLNKKDYIILTVITIIVGLCKIVYLPLVFLLFLIPKESMKNNKVYYILISSIILVSIFTSLFWLKNTQITSAEAAVKSKSQIEYVLKNPIEYSFTVLRTYLSTLKDNIFNLIGENGTYHGVTIYSAIIIIYLVILCCAIFNSESKKIVNVRGKALIVVITALICGLIATALYVQFTAMYYPIHYPIVQGIQGRYFIPLILMLILCVSKKQIDIKDDTLTKAVLVIQLPILLTMFISFLL